MQPFTELTGVAAPLLASNINTDLIAPTLVPGKAPIEIPLLPLKEKLFANLRYDPDGRDKPDFVLNQPRHFAACILLAGPNFGCGSSRETAVWSLLEFGIRCVIAPSFGDIFHDNAFQNGLLPVRLEMPTIRRIVDALAASATSVITVDLRHCVVTVPGLPPIAFSVSPDRRASLLSGEDPLVVLLRSKAEISDFERNEADARPWVSL